MLIRNQHPDHRQPLMPEDADTLGVEAAETVARFLSHRPNNRATPLRALPALAAELGIGAIHLKDEGYRLGLGSFKALGGAHAVIRLVLEEAKRELGRPVGIGELHSPEVAKISAAMTFGCATDGNHGRSVAQGAQLVGARSVIFVHGGVSDARVEAIARYGAEMVRVAGTYDDSVTESARVCAANGWSVVSDTSWPGYERIPGLVMQGYTAIMREALDRLPAPPTHVFVQAGVGGVAAATAAYLACRFGDQRPTFVVVDPARAACIFETARAGRPVKLQHGEPTVMAMLECYEPSLLAWRILARTADAFMTVEDEDAVEVMNRLARPLGHDPVVVAGESGAAGMAGVFRAARDPQMRQAIGLDRNSRVLLIVTEGATDPDRYRELVGIGPADLAANLAVVAAK
ncbi:diaminopropionate ammonia-lyase [Mesorhizobium sp. CC13]|uniref:diaminopropionate ammonia-lyase n=1 Tax=Mesorhizobium sp. CC13 TaxID=3029194 RepID=UPI0032639E53